MSVCRDVFLSPEKPCHKVEKESVKNASAKSQKRCNPRNRKQTSFPPLERILLPNTNPLSSPVCQFVAPAIHVQFLQITFIKRNSPNYSRWIIRRGFKLLNAKDNEDGAFSVKPTRKTFSHTAVDMTLKQTVNAYTSSSNTCMRVFIYSKNARKRWKATRSARTVTVSQLLPSVGLVISEEVTRDLRQHTGSVDHQDLDKL
ncbi:hypothetical protein LSH36_52g09050 [Paralvinella palmiformis]|uniref:Uncharacterized protein n=1 Tax=Paralvinella palmiformis TaxID=53620 RepID=A0AAD9K7A9_9ANNE|nr:hypothetical protein LSH36_52g09050 [Paralvinella palmiformis]